MIKKRGKFISNPSDTENLPEEDTEIIMEGVLSLFLILVQSSE